jgi:hypothetical protein
MKPTSSIPNSVLEAGLPARFRYWSGLSGKRYLFTRTDLAGLAHFDEAVVILVRYGRVIWAGDPPGRDSPAGELAALAGRHGTEIYIHLLARSNEQREAIIGDLKAVFDVEQTGAEHVGGTPARIIEFPVAA